MKAIRAHWDRLLTYLCFVAFGTATILQPLVVQSRVPAPFAILFDVQMIIAGVLLIISVFYPKFSIFAAGYTVYGLAMLTMGLLVLLRNQSPVGILVLGFACHALVSMRHVKRESEATAELAILAKQLAERRPEDDD